MLTHSTLFFDGGSRGNPGKAAGAAVIIIPEVAKPHTVARFIGIATNNEAEYTGLVIGLEAAIALGIKNIRIKGDSQLVVKQVKGEWQVKSDRLAHFHKTVRSLLSNFPQYSIEWIPREANKQADAAVNLCLDQSQSR